MSNQKRLKIKVASPQSSVDLDLGVIKLGLLGRSSLITAGITSAIGVLDLFSQNNLAPPFVALFFVVNGLGLYALINQLSPYTLSRNRKIIDANFWAYVFCLSGIAILSVLGQQTIYRTHFTPILFSFAVVNDITTYIYLSVYITRGDANWNKLLARYSSPFGRIVFYGHLFYTIVALIGFLSAAYPAIGGFGFAISLFSTFNDLIRNIATVNNLGVLLVSCVSLASDLFLRLAGDIVLLEEILGADEAEKLLTNSAPSFYKPNKEGVFVEIVSVSFIYVISNFVSAGIVAMSWNQYITNNLIIWLVVLASIGIGIIFFAKIRDKWSYLQVEIKVLLTTFVVILSCSFGIKFFNLQNSSDGLFTLFLLAVVNFMFEFLFRIKNINPNSSDVS